MGVLNPNSTNYIHPNEPNLTRLENAMEYNSTGQPVLRTHVDGITLQANDVIVDAVKIWDGAHYVTLENPNNDGEQSNSIYAISTENYNMVFNGSTWDRMRGNINDGVLTQISNDYLAISKDTNANSDSNRIYVNASGTVSLTAGTTVAVTGTFWPDTQPVSGTVSLSAGSLEALEHISVDNFPATYPITDNGGSITVDGSVSITGEVEVKNDTGNPLSISKNTTVNSASNRIYVSQETDVVLADSNYELNLARGLVDSQYVEMKNGYAPSLSPGTGANEPTVWGLNTPYPWSAWTGTGSRLWVASSDPADIGQTVYIDGLDHNFARINSTITLNGTTAVETVETFYRINRMYQLTGTTHAGNISARVTSSSGTQVGYMLAGNARGHGGFFTVPAGYTAYILYGDCSSYKNGSGNVSGQVDMYTRTNVNGTTMPFMNQFVAVVANGQYRNEFNVPLRVPEKTDIDVRFDASGQQTTVTVNWEMILIPN